MAYIGKQPLVGNYTVLDALTATTTDTYALTKNSVAVFPQTPANCIVSLNGVIQAPFDSYTISGSNIVFDSALTGSDSIDFITVLGDVLNVGTVSDGTITTDKLADSSVSLAKLTATGTKDATTFLRGDNTFASAGGANTPAFQAVLSGDQSLSAGSTTKVTFNSEIFDTNNNYDSSTNYRFTPTVAGKYKFYVSLQFRVSASNLYYCYAYIYKNGSVLVTSQNDFQNNNANTHNATVSYIVSMNGSTDYVEAYGHVYNAGTIGATDGGQPVSVFNGYKIIE